MTLVRWGCAFTDEDLKKNFPYVISTPAAYNGAQSSRGNKVNERLPCLKSAALKVPVSVGRSHAPEGGAARGR